LEIPHLALGFGGAIIRTPLNSAPLVAGRTARWATTWPFVLGALDHWTATMPRIPCSYCGERSRDKLAQIYMWWYAAEGDRVAYRLWCCAGCAADRWAKILQISNSTLTGEPTCIGCGGLLETDDSIVYLNLYLPKQTAREYELDFDAACAAKICADTSDFGKRLENRGAEVQGPRSSAPEPSPWDSLEL